MKKARLSILAGSCMMLIAAGASAEQYLPELASKTPYKKAYAQMLSFPSWVSKAQGTASPVERVSVEGKSFTVGHMCKPHDCADNQLSVVLMPMEPSPGDFSLRVQRMERPSTNRCWATLTKLSRDF